MMKVEIKGHGKCKAEWVDTIHYDYSGWEPPPAINPGPEKRADSALVIYPKVEQWVGVRADQEANGYDYNCGVDILLDGREICRWSPSAYPYHKQGYEIPTTNKVGYPDLHVVREIMEEKRLANGIKYVTEICDAIRRTTKGDKK